MKTNSNISTEELTREAVLWLREKLNDKYALVCFSGGKDSIVTEKLVRMSGVNHTLQSTLTGIDPPQVTRFIRKNYQHCKFVRPRQSFWHLITTHNPSGGTGRGIKWCCTKIKEWPSAKSPIVDRIIGIRAEESTGRRKYPRINHIESKAPGSKCKHQIHYYPIFYWKEWNVWEFIEQHGLAYPKLYDEGFDRLGCVICPNHHNHHEPYRERWPQHFKCFEKYVKIWWYKRKGQGREMWHNSPEEFLEDWYRGKFYYYKHDRP